MPNLATWSPPSHPQPTPSSSPRQPSAAYQWTCPSDSVLIEPPSPVDVLVQRPPRNPRRPRPPGRSPVTDSLSYPANQRQRPEVPRDLRSTWPPCSPPSTRCWETNPRRGTPCGYPPRRPSTVAITVGAPFVGALFALRSPFASFGLRRHQRCNLRN